MRVESQSEGDKWQTGVLSDMTYGYRGLCITVSDCKRDEFGPMFLSFIPKYYDNCLESGHLASSQSLCYTDCI